MTKSELRKYANNNDMTPSEARPQVRESMLTILEREYANNPDMTLSEARALVFENILKNLERKYDYR